MADVVEHLRRVLAQNAERHFLIEPSSGRKWTYKEFGRWIQSIARTLRSRGIERGERIALMLPNSAEFVGLYFGSLQAGIVAVPINAGLHPREINYILKHSGIKGVIYSEGTADIISTLRGAFSDKVFWRLRPEGAKDSDDLELRNDEGPEEALFRDVKAEEIFTITYTSGTTGMPKGVAHRVSGLFEAAMAFNDAVEMGPENRMYHVLPMSYMAGFLNTILCPFAAGASIVISRSFDARLALTFWQAPIDHAVNTFWLVPSILATLTKLDRDSRAPEFCRKNVRLICVGTAPLPLQVQKEFEMKFGAPVLESYGLSETLFVATNSPKWPRQAGSVGRILSGVELRVTDQNGAKISPLEEGELWVRSPFNMAGYVDPESFLPIEIEGSAWFQSGDIGRISAEGDLYITARKKDLIIRGGVNVSPRAIEDVLLEHAAVEQAAVIGLTNDLLGEEIIAVIRLKSGYTLNNERENLVSFCRVQLGASSRPDRYFALENFPVSVTGKIQKHKLRECLGLERKNP